MYLNSKVPPDERCFSIIGLGKATFRGFSILTTVPVFDVDGNSVSMPLGFEPGLEREYLQGFTSQVALTRRVKIQRKYLVGTIYTKDTEYIIPDPDPTKGAWVGQTLLIIGGEDDFENATGIISVAGKKVEG